MNVSLTPELEKFVDFKVGSGRYNSASEVVREALRLLEEHDQARGAQIAAFNQELGHRLAEGDPRLYLVAPALRVHPATEVVLRYLSPRVEWVLVALDERWRRQVKVVWRKRSGDAAAAMAGFVSRLR